MYKTRVAALAINGLLGNPRENLNAIEHRAKAGETGWRRPGVLYLKAGFVHGHCAPDTRHQAEPVLRWASPRSASARFPAISICFFQWGLSE